VPRPTPAEIGRLGEDLALAYLATCGYRCLARRVRRGRGEVDLVVARPGRCLFVEVKVRGHRSWGPSTTAVTDGKLWRLRTAARAWIAENPPPPATELRFDVVAIDLAGEEGGLVLRHFAGVI